MRLTHLLTKTYAHIPPARALEDLSEQDALSRISNTPHSIAAIVAHISFWQAWFLGRCRGESEGHGAAGVSRLAARRRRIMGGSPLRTDLVDQPLHPAIEFPPLAGRTVREVLLHVASHRHAAPDHAAVAAAQRRLDLVAALR